MTKHRLIAGLAFVACPQLVSAELLDPAHLYLEGPSAVMLRIAEGFKQCGMNSAILRPLKNGRSTIAVYSRNSYEPVQLGSCTTKVVQPYKRTILMRQIEAATD